MQLATCCRRIAGGINLIIQNSIIDYQQSIPNDTKQNPAGNRQKLAGRS